MVFPTSKLPSAAQPWGRFVEKSITNVEALVSTERVNNAARDAQNSLNIKRLDQSVTAVAAATVAAQQAADDAQAAIDGLTSLGSIDSDYTINAGNINAGTLTGVTIQTAASGTRLVLNESEMEAYYNDGSSDIFVGTVSGSTANVFGPGSPYPSVAINGLNGNMVAASDEFTVMKSKNIADNIDFSSYVIVGQDDIFIGGNGTNANVAVECPMYAQDLFVSAGGTMPTSWQTAGLAHIAGGSLRLAVNGVGLGISRPSSTGSIASFQNGSTQVGSISITASATAYNTSSDYRLKDNVVPLEGSLERLMQLKPSRFNFKAEPDKIVDGFIAHEVAEIIPEAIYGEKDGVDEEGNPEYQGIDQSKIVPLLTAAVQELAAKVATLEGK